MSNVKFFEHPEFGVIRALTIEGKPWFVGRDAARVLGYNNTFNALTKHVPDEDKRIEKNDSFKTPRGMILINEDGLYSLIHDCKQPVKNPFKSWIEDVVLPFLQKLDDNEKNDVFQSKYPDNDVKTDEKCAIKVFENPEFGTVRTLEENGKVLFCGKDIAAALGYSNTKDALAQHCQWVVKRDLWVQTGTKVNGSAAVRQTAMSFIPEGDVYRLVTHSKLPAAKKFERWVFDEVLPTIRKHGMYAAEELLNDPDTMIKVLEALKEERAAKEALAKKNQQLTQDKNLLEQKNFSQAQKIALLHPKAKYYDTCLFCSDLIPISIISKDFGWSANQMNRFLCEQGVQYRQGDGWLLSQKYAERGYASSRTYVRVGQDGKTHANVRTCWTQKGRRFIFDLMKAHGHLPIVEYAGKVVECS